MNRLREILDSFGEPIFFTVIVSVLVIMMSLILIYGKPADKSKPFNLHCGIGTLTRKYDCVLGN